MVKNSGYMVAMEYHLLAQVQGVFGNDFARNVVILGVDNSSSSHANNCKNQFLVFGEGQIFGINGSFGSPRKELVLIQ